MTFLRFSFASTSCAAILSLLQTASATAQDTAPQSDLQRQRVELERARVLGELLTERSNLQDEYRKTIYGAALADRISKLQVSDPKFQEKWTDAIVKYSFGVESKAAQAVMVAKQKEWDLYRQTQNNHEPKAGADTGKRGGEEFYRGMMKNYGVTAADLNEIDATPGALVYEDRKGKAVSSEEVRNQGEEKYFAVARIGEKTLKMPLDKFQEALRTHRNIQAGVEPNEPTATPSVEPSRR